MLTELTENNKKKKHNEWVLLKPGGFRNALQVFSDIFIAALFRNLFSSVEKWQNLHERAGKPVTYSRRYLQLGNDNRT